MTFNAWRKRLGLLLLARLYGSYARWLLQQSARLALELAKRMMRFGQTLNGETLVMLARKIFEREVRHDLPLRS
jgi:hypothetical protein